MVVYDFLDMEHDWSSDKALFQDYKLSEMKFKNIIEIVEFAVGELFRTSKDIELLQIDETKDKDVSQLVQMMNELILDPNNYVSDLYAAFYMSILYNDPNNKIIVSELEAECQKQMHKAINVAGGKNRGGTEAVHRLNGSDYERYPVPLYYNDLTEKLVMIPGGCMEYHRHVIHRKYFGFYDMSKNNAVQEDYSRHSYTKIQNLWDCLRKSNIENLLMMEYNLGSGCACYLFEKLSWIRTDSELFAWKDFIELVREFPHFFIRKQILELLFRWLEEKKYYTIGEVECKRMRSQVVQIFSKVINIVESKYIKSLKLFSYLVWGEGRTKTEAVEMSEEELLIFQNILATAWTGYYDNYFTYNKCVEPIIGKGWYCLDSYEPCFYKRPMKWVVSEQAVLESLHEIELNVPKDYKCHIDNMIVRTDEYYKYTIVCQEPCNPVGWELWKYACEYFMNNPTPEGKKDAERLFDQKLKERFAEKKQENEKRLNGKEAKANKGKVAASDLCKYGYIQRHLVSGYPKNSSVLA